MHNEDLVNLPNWLVLKLRIEGADAIRLAHNLIQDGHANF
jgi:trehalose/maltose hydrolase-like predicted phosphorylase